MAFPPGFLDELRSRVPLGDLVGRRVRLTRRGREQGGLCPFHNEKTPSFYVVEDKGFFHCFGCGAHGDAIGFLMRADNLDFIEAVERLAGEAGLTVPQQTPQDRERAQRQKTLLEALAAAAAFYEAQLWAPSGARARDYLTRARSRRGNNPALPPRLGARQPPVVAPCARRRISRADAARSRADAHSRNRRQPLRLFPRPGDVPDRGPRRPGHRLRRSHHWRRSAEISQFARYPALREGPGSLCLGGSASQRPSRHGS